MTFKAIVANGAPKKVRDLLRDFHTDTGIGKGRAVMAAIHLFVYSEKVDQDLALAEISVMIASEKKKKAKVKV